MTDIKLPPLALVEPDHETALALADAPRSIQKYVATLRSAIARHLSSKQPAIPPGYVVVPVEPTEEMIAAGLAFTDNKLLWHISRGAAQDFYKAMLASAPAIQPQAASVQAAEKDEGFYIASFKNRRSNGVICWWGPDNCGYTPYLEQAGIYKAEEITKGYHDNEYTVPVPVSYAKKFSVSQVDMGLSEHKHWWNAGALRAALAAPADSKEGKL